MGTHVNTTVFYGVPLTEDEYEACDFENFDVEEVCLDEVGGEYAHGVGIIQANFYQDEGFTNCSPDDSDTEQMVDFCEKNGIDPERIGVYVAVSYC